MNYSFLPREGEKERAVRGVWSMVSPLARPPPLGGETLSNRSEGSWEPKSGQLLAGGSDLASTSLKHQKLTLRRDPSEIYFQ